MAITRDQIAANAEELLRELQREGMDYSAPRNGPRPVDIISALEANPNLTLADVLPPESNEPRPETLSGLENAPPAPRETHAGTALFPLPPLSTEPRTDMVPPGQGLEPQPNQFEQGLRLHARGEHGELAQDAGSARQVPLTAMGSAIGAGAATAAPVVANLIGRGASAAVGVASRNPLPFAFAGAAGAGAVGAAAQQGAAGGADPRNAEIERLRSDIARRERLLQGFATQNFQSKTAREAASSPHLSAIEQANAEIRRLTRTMETDKLDAEQRVQADTRRNSAWTQLYPWLVPAMGGAGAGIGTMVSNTIARRAVNSFNTRIEDLSRRWGEAVARAESATSASKRQQHLTRAQELGRQFETLERRGPSRGQMHTSLMMPAAGAEVGVTAPLAMDVWHSLSTPPNSPARQHVQAQGSDWREIAARYGLPLVGGAAMGKIVGGVNRSRMSEPANFRAETLALGGELPVPPSFWQRVFGRGGSTPPSTPPGTAGPGAASLGGTGQQRSLPSPQATIESLRASDRPPAGVTFDHSVNRWVVNGASGRRFVAGRDHWPDYIPPD